jgi:hypothetical protein
MLTGWHLAQADSRDNFVLDPAGYIDFASNLDERINHLIEQIKNDRYRPRHLLDIDLPKTGLSVRPGNVLPIEEAILLHSMIYLLAPILDKKLVQEVYSFRLHPDWKKRIKKRDSLFRESEIEFPFLKRQTIRSISPFEEWYERWPQFEADSRHVCLQEDYNHLTKTDITAYFENVDLRLLETQIRSHLKGKEDKIVQILFRILKGWTRTTSIGTPIERGIPQGNEVSSFLSNIYLLPLDIALIQFCKKHDAKWLRYVDDVKVFTKSRKDALEVVFVINDVLRSLYLNLQGSKTKILSGAELYNEVDDSDLQLVDSIYDKIKKINVHKKKNYAKVTKHLKAIKKLASHFRKKLPDSVRNLSSKNNRLFRRLMTIYGRCINPYLKKAAITALKELPDLKILDKSLTYLSQLDYDSHDEIAASLFKMLELKQLPFPYQIGCVLETISFLHPQKNKTIASKARKYGLSRKQHWFIILKALEIISSYPYKAEYAQKLANDYLKNDHPMVRRAACVLALHGTKKYVRKKLEEMIYHPDPNLNRLALYYLRLLQDDAFALKEINHMKNGNQSDTSLQRNLSSLYAIAATEHKGIAKVAYYYLKNKYRPVSVKLKWHQGILLKALNWAK